MKNALNISPELALPVECVTQTLGVLAMRGAGKTHLAKVIAEEMLKRDFPIVAYDPTGAWWGLKSSADGKSPGFPVVVFGGEHADVPIEVHEGRAIANAVVAKRVPTILDVSQMRKSERTSFMADFCEELYHRNRAPLHFFCDEAHTLAPNQNSNRTPSPDTSRLIGAMKDIQLQGRIRGLGLTLITQRPAMLNATLRMQCASLFLLRLIGNLDRKAINEWIGEHGADAKQVDEFNRSVQSLPDGDTYFWSPGWLRKFVRTRARELETFDSSATPGMGKRVRTPKALAAVDVAALGDEIKAAAERAKETSPAMVAARKHEVERLRARVAELEARPAATPRVDKTLVRTLKDAHKWAEKNATQFSSNVADLAEIHASAKAAVDAMWASALALKDAMAPSTPAPAVLVAPPLPRHLRDDAPVANGELPQGPRKILKVIAQRRPMLLSKSQIGTLAGYTPSSMRVYLGPLRAGGYVERTGKGFTLTEKGLRTLGPDAAVDARDAGKSAFDLWTSKLAEGPAKILRAIRDAGGDTDKADVMVRTGYTSSTVRVYVGPLRSNGLLEKGKFSLAPMMRE